jgi:predicted DNA-binding protein
VPTTTIRVDTETHERLLEMSEQSGATLMQTLRDATEALRRERFAHQVAAELAALREDPKAWADYLTEGDSTSVADGIG